MANPRNALSGRAFGTLSTLLRPCSGPLGFTLGGKRMASSVWKGTLTFGLLAIPVKLYTAARSQRMNLHQLHKVCHTRLKQPLYCPHCNRQVDRSEVVRGYEYEKGRYVVINEDEIKKITPRSSTVMEIVAFVKQE